MRIVYRAGIVAVMAAAGAWPNAAVAADDGGASVAPDAAEIVVQGILPADAATVPGAFDIVTREQIAARAPFSIKEMLNQVPGINVVDEDASGLALNIGVRGLDPRRSARTLLMEDGVPIFLAPYGDPSAHYSPPIERVERIEVVRGSGQVLYGPQTVGGMINFITTTIPRDGLALRGQAAIGNRAFRSGHAGVGYGTDAAGVMVEATTRAGDGVRDNHRFDILDLIAKARVRITPAHELRARISRYEERSNITETMLGALEYAEDPFQAPTGRLDRFRMDRTQAQLTHLWTPSDSLRLSTNAYYARTFRASFRQTDKPGGYDDGPDERGLSTGYTTLDRCFDEDDPAPGTGGAAGNRITRAASEACGGRWRPRRFRYGGIEPRLDIRHRLLGIDSDAVFGARWHREDIARDQFRSADPRIQDLDFAYTLAGYDEDDPRDIAGNGDQHREQARIRVTAWSIYGQNSFRFDDWAVTAGARVESIRNRTTILRSGSAPNGSRLDDRRTVVIPGLGATWSGLAGTVLFAGVHRGFAPPRPSRDIGTFDAPSAVGPERSTNWELGFRSTPRAGITLASTVFHTAFDQIVISSAAGRFVNGGKSEQSGIELSGRIDAGTLSGNRHNVYLLGTYTGLANARFLTTSDAAFNAGDGGVIGAACEDDDGCFNGNGIIRGTRLPYAPRHLLSLNLGYQHPAGIDARIGADYRSAQQPDAFARVLDTTVNDSGCSDAACSGLAGRIPGVVLLNASITFRPEGSRFSVFASGFNLADRTYLASRVDGMVAGRRRTLLAGVRFGL